MKTLKSLVLVTMIAAILIGWVPIGRRSRHRHLQDGYRGQKGKLLA
jgi:hypothetical protein